MYSQVAKYEKHSFIECKINQEVGQNIDLAPPTPKSVGCLVDDSKNEVYLPFTFIKKYFDVSTMSSSHLSNMYTLSIRDKKRL